MTKGKKKNYTSAEYKKHYQKILVDNFAKDGAAQVKLLMPKVGYHFMEIGTTGCKAWVEDFGSYPRIVFSYPAATDQRTIRKLLAQFDPILKDLCSLQHVIKDGRVIGARRVTIPFGNKTGITDFIKKRNLWIKTEIGKQRKLSRKALPNDSVYQAVLGRLKAKRPFEQQWNKIKNVQREFPLKRDPYSLSVSAIKNIYLTSQPQ